MASRRIGRSLHDGDGLSEDLLAVHLQESAVFGVEDAGRGAVGPEVPAEELAASGLVSLDDRGTGAVAEQDAGAPVGVVGDAVQALGPDHQDVVETLEEQPVGDDETVDPARAHGLEIEGAAVERRGRRPRPGPCPGRCSRGRWWPGSTWPMSAGSTPDCVEGLAGGRDGESSEVDPPSAASADARPLADPFVGGVHRATVRSVVGDDLLGEGRADPGEPEADGCVGPVRRSCGALDQAVRSQAMGWDVVTRSPSMARTPWSSPANGDRTSTAPTWPTSAPGCDAVLPVRPGSERLEDTGGWTHDEAFDRRRGTRLRGPLRSRRHAKRRRAVDRRRPAY